MTCFPKTSATNCAAPGIGSRATTDASSGQLNRRALAERLSAQGLTAPLGDPVAVAERLLAIQAQDPRGARLAVRARTDGLTVTDVDRALTEDRTLLITWLNRGTLHLVRSDDYPWLQALTTPPLFTTNETRLRQEGVDTDETERAVGIIERGLGAHGPMTRFELREHLDSEGIRTAGQAFAHLMMLASLRGIAVRGPMVGKQHAYVLVRDWIGEQEPVDRDSALAELARRYLAGHEPASDRDLARWSGLPLRDARAALEAIASDLEGAGKGAVRLRRRRRHPADAMPPPLLLGAFDPTLLGWCSREEIVGEHASRIVSGGVFRPFAVVGGRAVATWKWVGGEVLVDPFDKISTRTAKALDREAADVARFLST